MSELIVPGRGSVVRKESELPKQSTVQQEVNDGIDMLIRDAKAANFASPLDYLKHLFTTWNKEHMQEVIKDGYEKYLECVQHHQQKPYPDNGRWGERDSFETYLEVAAKDLDTKIEELKWKLKSQHPAFAKAAKYMQDNKATNIAHGVGKSVSQEDFDIMELMMRKTQETYRYYVNHSVELNALLSEFNQQAKERLKDKFDNIK